MTYFTLRLTRAQQMALTTILGEALRTQPGQSYIDVSSGEETTVGQLLTLAMEAPAVAPIMAIKPCPFCQNGKDLQVLPQLEHQSEPDTVFAVCCLDCGARGPEHRQPTAAHA